MFIVNKPPLALNFLKINMQWTIIFASGDTASRKSLISNTLLVELTIEVATFFLFSYLHDAMTRHDRRIY